MISKIIKRFLKSNKIFIHDNSIGIGERNPVSGLHMGKGAINNIYLDSSVEEKQVIFNNGKTNTYIYGNVAGNPYGESVGMIDSTNQRNVWFYRPEDNCLHLGIPTVLPRLTEEQKSNLSFLIGGMIIFNVNTNNIEVYNGTEWRVM
jgi:hypothetical protein